ncbi:MAG: nitroreductase family protein [Bifidobacteriaceae bacterium]|jgi:nitroreductase|nr:nitroreductase family protein [Bifidobacteriaceae bacterium]
MTERNSQIQNHARAMVREALHFRRATKSFDPNRIIPDEDWAVIIEAAVMAPSSNHLDPFNLLVIQDSALREQLVEKAAGAQAGQFRTASHLVAITAKAGAQMRPGSPHLAHLRQDIMQFPPEQMAQWEAQFAGFLTNMLGIPADDDRLVGEWTRHQAYIVLGMMMQTAALLGIDSCPLEGLDFAAADAVLAEAGVHDPTVDPLAVMVAFGYRAGPPKRASTRRPLAEIVKVV